MDPCRATVFDHINEVDDIGLDPYPFLHQLSALTITWGQCTAHPLKLGLATRLTLANGIWVKLTMCQF